jgi:F0F1-type ATP synthase assembly protein I
MLLTIPTLLLVAPLVGFFMGKAADRWLKTSPWLSFAGLVLGFIAAGREIWTIIRRVEAEGERESRR